MQTGENSCEIISENESVIAMRNYRILTLVPSTNEIVDTNGAGPTRLSSTTSRARRARERRRRLPLSALRRSVSAMIIRQSKSCMRKISGPQAVIGIVLASVH